VGLHVDSPSMNIPKKTYISIISKVIWMLERVFFYPKLTSGYKDLKLSTKHGKDMIIFDVGANKGQSIRFFKKLFPQSQIYGFEPSVYTFKALNAFIKNKTYAGVFIFPFGLGDSPKKLLFYESDLSETSTFATPNSDSKYSKMKNRILFQNDSHAYRSRLMKITTLDHFVEENKIDFIDILKIDVEGFELEVIHGAKKILENSKVEILQIENQENDMFCNNFPEIDSFLRDRNYSLIKGFKHPFGNFRDILYQRCEKCA
jgi:FkbM family methyltransferase